jgi:predicted nucleotidyltransferase
VFAAYPQVQAVFLFGSRAFGGASPDSGWDLAVYLEPSASDPTLEILRLLADVTGLEVQWFASVFYIISFTKAPAGPGAGG